MEERVNKTANPLSLQSGDYVWLQREPTGKGRKLQYCAEGPYVVAEIQSPHRVMLSNPTTGERHKNAVHVNRLRMAYVREPNPVPYFVDKLVTNKDHNVSQGPVFKLNPLAKEFVKEKKVENYTGDTVYDSGPSPVENMPSPTLRRSARQNKAPVRFGHLADPTYSLGYDTVGSDSKGYHKIKRVLGQRQKDGKTEYFVHLCGEPSQNAFWVPESKLNVKARKAVQQKPPPIIQS